MDAPFFDPFLRRVERSKPTPAPIRRDRTMPRPESAEFREYLKPLQDERPILPQNPYACDKPEHLAWNRANTPAKLKAEGERQLRERAARKKPIFRPTSPEEIGKTFWED